MHVDLDPGMHSTYQSSKLSLILKLCPSICPNVKFEIWVRCIELFNPNTSCFYTWDWKRIYWIKIRIEYQNSMELFSCLAWRSCKKKKQTMSLKVSIFMTQSIVARKKKCTQSGQIWNDKKRKKNHPITSNRVLARYLVSILAIWVACST